MIHPPAGAVLVVGRPDRTEVLVGPGDRGPWALTARGADELLEERGERAAREHGAGRFVVEAGHGWSRAGERLAFPSAVELDAAGEVVAW